MSVDTLEDCTSQMSASLDDLDPCRSDLDIEGIELTPRPTAIIVTSPPQHNGSLLHHKPPAIEPKEEDTTYTPIPYKEVIWTLQCWISWNIQENLQNFHDSRDWLLLFFKFQVGEEGGVHYLEDGHYWMEVAGLDDLDSEPEVPCPVKINRKVQFSQGPMKVMQWWNDDIMIM